MNANEYFEDLSVKHEMEDPGSNYFNDCSVDLAKKNDERKEKLPKLFHDTSFDEILDMELSSEKWLVDGIIPETGLHLFVGAEKIGKSWFTLQCAQGIATGGSVFGKIPVNQNKVLFFSLEESRQLLQKRAKFLNFSKSGGNLMVVDKINHREFYNTVDVLDEKLKRDPSIRFVIIDTIQLFLDVADLNKDLMTVYTLQALKDVAYIRQVSILMVHYSNKIGHYESLNSIVRSLGRKEIVALCDTIIFLTKLRNERRANMFVTGSETMDKEYIFRMDDNFGWVLEGDKREVVEGDTQKLIAAWIKENCGGRPIDIYKGLKVEGYKGTADTIRKTCQRMRIAGKLRKVCDKYVLYILLKPHVTPVSVLQLEYKEDDALIPPVAPVTVSQLQK